MMTSGMHRRPFDGRHLVYTWILMKFALNGEAKGVFMIRRLIFEFQFCSYACMSLTCSRSFLRGVARLGLHLFSLYVEFPFYECYLNYIFSANMLFPT